jgi:hypothetical protein
MRSAVAYSCPAWEFPAGTQILKVQRLKNKVLLTIGKCPSCTPVCDLNTAFNLPRLYGCITKLYRQQAEVIQNQENEHIRNTGQGEATDRKKLKVSGGQAYDRSRD